jgi:hypothetical protein
VGFSVVCMLGFCVAQDTVMAEIQGISCTHINEYNYTCALKTPLHDVTSSSESGCQVFQPAARKDTDPYRGAGLAPLIRANRSRP